MGEKYVIDKETLDDVADAIREKSGSAGSMPGSAMAGKIRAIELGVKLPILSNPAAAAQIFSGYQAIDGAGQAMTGTAGSNITNAATAAKIAQGFQALDKAGNLLTGTMAQYFFQHYTSNITSTSSSSNTRTITATGSSIVLAIGYHEVKATPGSRLTNIGIISDGVILKEKIGEAVNGKISSVSGNKITAVGSPTDVRDYDDLIMHFLIISCN